MKIIFNIIIFLTCTNILFADHVAIVYDKNTLEVKQWSRISSPADFTQNLESNELVAFKQNYVFEDPYKSIEDISLGKLLKFENEELKSIPKDEIENRREKKRRKKKLETMSNLKVLKAHIDSYIESNPNDSDAKEKSKEIDSDIKSIEKDLKDR